MTIVSYLFAGAVILFFGWLMGKTNQGRMAEATNELPDCIFVVVYSDKTCTVLRALTPNQSNFLVPTEVFGGKTIRAKDQVRKVLSNKEMKAHELPVLGYPPLIKIEQE